VCDLETSRIGAPYIYIYIYICDISSLRVNNAFTAIGICHTSYVGCLLARSSPSAASPRNIYDGQSGILRELRFSPGSNIPPTLHTHTFIL